MDTAAWPAIDQRPNMAPALVAGSYDDFRIGRVDDKLVDTGIFINIQDTFPASAAIGGTIQTTVTTRIPQRTLGGYVDGITVPGMETDHRNVTRVFQTHVFPALAAVNGFVDAITETDAALGVVLAAAYPDDVRVFRVNFDHTNGE